MEPLVQFIPRDDMCLPCTTRAMAQFHRKEPCSTRSSEEIGDAVDLMRPLIIDREMLGEVESIRSLFDRNALAFDPQVIIGIQGVNQHVKELWCEAVLFESVSDPFDVLHLEKGIERSYQYSFKLCHVIPYLVLMSYMTSDTLMHIFLDISSKIALI